MSITPASGSLTTTIKPVNANANFAGNLAKIKNSDEQSRDTPLTDTVTLTQISQGRTDNLDNEMSKLSDESFKSSDSSLTTTPPPSLAPPSTLIDTPPIVSDETDTSRMDHIRLGTIQDALSDIDTSRLSEAKNFGQFVSAIKRFLSTLTGSQAKASDLLPLTFTSVNNNDNTDSTIKPAASMTGSLDITG